MSCDLDASPVLTISEFESRSSDGIFIGYASHSRAYRVLIIDTNIVRETCEVTFDETALCNSSVFEVAGDEELGTPIFEDEEEEAAEGDAEATTCCRPSRLRHELGR